MESHDLKQTVRLFTCGLYAVSVRRNDDEVNAFTANWLTQASFDPPLVVLSIEPDSRSWSVLKATGTFVVKLLESGQRGLASRLGKTRHRAGAKLAEIP